MNMKRTYLNGSIKNGNVMRWSINPLVVYIAPMKFYSKQGEDHKYRKMVLDALNAWSVASGNNARISALYAACRRRLPFKHMPV